MSRPAVLAKAAHGGTSGRFWWAWLVVLTVCTLGILSSRPAVGAELTTATTPRYHTVYAVNLHFAQGGTAYTIDTLTATLSVPSRGLVATVLDVDTVRITSDGPTSLGAVTLTVAAEGREADDTPVYEVVSQTLTVRCPTNLLLVDAAVPECLPAKSAPVLPAEGLAPGETESAVPSGHSNPHTIFSVVSDNDGCAFCHRVHEREPAAYIASISISRSASCLTCHNGLGASGAVADQYAAVQAAGLANDAASGSYYTHDALAVNSPHQSGWVNDDGESIANNEFEGVLNRHSDCVDCHNPHGTDSATATQLTVGGSKAGWVVSGSIQGISVASTAGSAATFVPAAKRVNSLDPTDVNFEFQLCMKCHSSFTSLPIASVLNPSAQWHDKSNAIDTNTAVNSSFHPVARPGTNASETMTASLSGPSAWKLWRFAVTDTVRCVNCHASAAVSGKGPGQSLAPHASTNRGLLLLPYRDRALIPADDTATVTWTAGRFALCFACHTDVPFTDASSTAGTAFRYHYEHIQAIDSPGGPGGNSGSIDDPGAGNGKAVCSECHFQLHSAKDKYTGNGQSVDGSRLVNFAPNVEAVSGVLRWTARDPGDGTAVGTCTLKCHGVQHIGTAY